MRNNGTAAVTVLVALFLGCELPAQAASSFPRNYSVTTWTDRDGLPSDHVRTIAQDKDGFLWLGTDAGLVRFDGFDFEPWDSRPGGSLPQADIRIVMTARDGSLWVAFQGSGRLAHIVDGRVDLYNSETELPTYVLALAEDQEGAVWAGGSSGLARFKGGRWERVWLPRESLVDITVESLLVDKDGRLWIGSTGGLFLRHEGIRVDRVGSRVGVLDLSQAENGTVWAATRGGVPYTPTETDPRMSASLAKAVSTSVRILHNGPEMWVATRDDGVVLLRSTPETNEFPAIERFKAPQHLPDNLINSLFRDHDGNIWVGTMAGLTRMSPANIRSVPLGDTAGSVSPSTLEASGSELFVGTSHGLVTISNGILTRYPLAISIGALHRDAQGTLWIGTSAGVFTYRRGRIEPFRPSQGELVQHVVALTSDRDGAIWLCDYVAGVSTWRHGQLTRITSISRDALGPASVAVTDSSGIVWIGFMSGELVSISERDAARIYTTRDGLPGGAITSIMESKDRAIWAVSNNGVTRLSQSGLERVTPEQGLPHGKLGPLLQDQSGLLWLGTPAGLVNFSEHDFLEAARRRSQSLTYRLYNSEDGLAGSPLRFGESSGAATSDGYLWFITSYGLSRLSPKSLKQPLGYPVPIFKDVLVNGESQSDGARFTVPPNPSRVEITYSAIELTSPRKVHFRYMLEGFDDRWIDNSFERAVSWTKLSPGTYTLRLIASMQGQQNASPERRLSFEVQPALIQTKWFWLAVLTVIAIGTTTAFQVRARHLRAHFAAILAERSRISRDIHDTLLQSLVGASLHLDNLCAEYATLPAEVTGNIRRIKTHLEHSVDDANLLISHLRSADVQEGDLLSNIRRLAERLAAEGRVKITVTSAESKVECAPTAQEQVLRIAREAIANATRHGEATAIVVHLARQDNAATVTVADNGHGFSKNASILGSREHWGLAMIRERAALLGGRVDVSSAPGAGVTVTIRFPLEA